MAAIDLPSLVHRVGSGDPGAESELAQHYGQRIYALAYARTRDAEVARDLTQDTLLALITALRKRRLQEPDNLTGFVMGTARNLVSNYFRQQGRRLERQVMSEDVPAPPAWDGREHEERNEMLAKALQRLEPNDVEVLRMTLTEDLNPAQIAMRLGLSSDVVRQRKSRALKRVMEQLEKMRSH